MIKSCIFDLDGTLLNSIDTIAHYVNFTFQKYNIPSLTTDFIKEAVGNGARDLIRKCLLGSGAYRSDGFFERVYADYKSAYDAAPTYLTAPYDKIPELIGELRSHGILLGVLSNKPHSAVLPIVKHFFGDSFDLVYGGVDGYPLKPDPLRLLHMAEDFGVSPSEVAYFGDMVSDIKTGKNGGVGITVGVLWGYGGTEALISAGADRLVENPMEIEEVLL